jgi:transposase InsO family protein
MKLVKEWLSGRYTMTELAATYSVSRKTGYKWVERFERGGRAALDDQSRRPQHHPATTDPAIVERLLAARQRFPHWSAPKLVTWLARHEPGRSWPRRTAAYEVLRRQGLSRGTPRRRRRPPVVRVLTAPTRINELWTTDFKGHFRMGNRCYCHPLTLRDAVSRFVLRCDGLPHETEERTRPCFERAFREYGVPERIRSDNGRPFAGTGLAGLSRLSVWWLRLGIQLERITPGRPEQNGSHEQFHAVLKRHTARPPATDLRAQQRRFDAFQREYNEQRPHDALDGESPARWYLASPRPYPSRLPALDYPSHWDVRRVATNGTISWRNRPVFVTEALRGEPIGWEEHDDGIWAVWYGRVQLARYDERTRTWC